VHGRPADVRSSSLLSLLQASRTLTKVFRPESPEMPLRKKELEQRATAVADADWATAATKKAIRAIETALATVVVVPVIVAGAGS
jgi:hypothetical protein